jgi:hypothetical protein
LVAANENAKEDAHQATKIEARRPRRNHSSSRTRKVPRPARAEAMVTIQIPPRTSCWCLRKISRKRRRVRLRRTAPPTRLEVTKPAREGAADSAFFKKPIVSVSPRMVFPSVRTRRNSESRVNRRDFGKRKRFSIDRILVRAMWVVSCRARGSLAV